MADVVVKRQPCKVVLGSRGNVDAWDMQRTQVAEQDPSWTTCFAAVCSPSYLAALNEFHSFFSQGEALAVSFGSSW